MVASLAWMRNKVVVGTSITPDRGEGEQNKTKPVFVFVFCAAGLLPYEGTLGSFWS